MSEPVRFLTLLQGTAPQNTVAAAAVSNEIVASVSQIDVVFPSTSNVNSITPFCPTPPVIGHSKTDGLTGVVGFPARKLLTEITEPAT